MTINEVEQSALAEFELYWAEWGEKYEAAGVDSEAARMLFLSGYSIGASCECERLAQHFREIDGINQ